MIFMIIAKWCKMFKWDTMKSLLMGNVCKQRNRSVQIRRSSRSLSLLTGGSAVLQTHQAFYEEFHKQLKEEGIRELISLFRMISISPEATSKCFCRFLTKESFGRTFIIELRRYDEIMNRKEKRRGRVQDYLKQHCFAVLTSHIEIMRNVYDSNFIENHLSQLALSHCFLQDVKSNFKIHDYLLKKFLNEELGQYMNKNTKAAIKKYMALIKARLLILTEQNRHIERPEVIAEAMEGQKLSVRSKVDQLCSFTQLYRNPATNSTSDYALRPFDSVYPGTSKGGSHRLDKA